MSLKYNWRQLPADLFWLTVAMLGCLAIAVMVFFTKFSGVDDDEPTPMSKK